MKKIDHNIISQHYRSSITLLNDLPWYCYHTSYCKVNLPDIQIYMFEVFINSCFYKLCLDLRIQYKVMYETFDD